MAVNYLVSFVIFLSLLFDTYGRRAHKGTQLRVREYAWW
jgi:hypothetical protein